MNDESIISFKDTSVLVRYLRNKVSRDKNNVTC